MTDATDPIGRLAAGFDGKALYKLMLALDRTEGGEA